ncbi:MAG: inositol monophosphatase family protein [Rhodocyclaceae bacterium]
MKLLNLAARVSCAFSSRNSQQTRTVQKVKDNQSRDVVTELDMRLHRISEQFVAERLPGCRLLSEEGGHEALDTGEIWEGEWLIVDPLDGSNNHALAMPNYGYMAAHMRNGRLDGAVIVVPEHNQYIVLEAGQSLYSQPLPLAGASEHGTVYYAYPPKQDKQARQARGALQDLIDAESAGMYRYGSACAGLYQLLCGRHMAFVGHGIRVWDAIAFLPVLASRQIPVKYAITGQSITLVAGTKAGFLEGAEQILKTEQGLALHTFRNDSLRADAQ